MSARPAAPRICLTVEEAAQSLGCSRDSLERHILGELRVVRRGRLILIPVVELQRWADREAARTIPERGGA